ncbi:uncharacterized protein LOC108101262 [Drosophila ficusphila]|uniref:uncharacterized protein LOC108101262 n=1 Tax=Drosophila ficusphila TaxID=30025 RepID=UPI0007E664DB|nr:uncharacterized protein LOC108101262 [Drosophila ficusphila]
MKKNNIWNTLQEVDKVEASFNKTLRNINNIQNRYKVVSALNRKAAERQNSYEQEIQSAITEPKITKPSKKTKTKKYKAKTLTKKKILTKKTKRCPLPILQPLPSPETLSQMGEPFVCVQTNCVYEIHKTTTHVVARKPYRGFIKRLYRAAWQKNRQDQNPDLYKELDPDRATFCCSCSSCCFEYK